MRVLKSNKDLFRLAKISIFKGEEQEVKTGKDGRTYNKFGADLKTKFRIEIEDPYLQGKFREYYPSYSPLSPYVEELDIFFYWDAPDQVLDPLYYQWNASLKQPYRVCDGTNILRQFDKMEKDSEGNSIPVFKTDPSPCEGKNGHGCSECKLQVVMFMEIVQLSLRAREPVLAKITLNSVYNILDLQDRLSEFYKRNGSLLASPTEFPPTEGKIPYKLYRTEATIQRPDIERIESAGKTKYVRTGKSKEGKHYPITVSLNEGYAMYLSKISMQKQFQLMGHDIHRSQLFSREEMAFIMGSLPISPQKLLPSQKINPPLLDQSKSEIYKHKITEVIYELTDGKPDLRRHFSNPKAIAAIASESLNRIIQTSEDLNDDAECAKVCEAIKHKIQNF